MTTYSVRPTKPDDIEAVYKIITAQNTADYGSAMLTMDDLQKKWQSLDLGDDTCIAFLDSELVGYAEVLNNDSPFIYLANRNNVNLAFQLLMILEGKATSRKKAGETVNLFTRISANNNTLLQLFASNGYRSNLSFIIMETNLTEPPPVPQWPEGITVRIFVQDQDEQAIYQADEEAAQDKGYHEPLSYEAWTKRMGLDRETFDPSLWFLVCEGNDVIGAALNLRGNEADTGWVDHLSVRRTWRKKGIGKALLLHTFAEFYKRDIHRVKLSVDSKSLTNAPHLYESVGMQTVQEYYIYRKEI